MLGVCADFDWFSRLLVRSLMRLVHVPAREPDSFDVWGWEFLLEAPFCFKAPRIPTSTATDRLKRGTSHNSGWDCSQLEAPKPHPIHGNSDGKDAHIKLLNVSKLPACASVEHLAVPVGRLVEWCWIHGSVCPPKDPKHYPCFEA